MDEEQKVLLVLDGRFNKIFTYALEPDPGDSKKLRAIRLDNHHTEHGQTDDDDFILFKTNTLSNQLTSPYGIWANGTTDNSTLWVSDFTDGKIYAYDLKWHQTTIATNPLPNSWQKYAKGSRHVVVDEQGKDTYPKDFNAFDEDASDNRTPKPQGIWANGAKEGSIMWVADDRAKKIFAYEYDGVTFARVNNSTNDFTRKGTAVDPNFNENDMTTVQGIWSDDETMWVVDNEGAGKEQKILAYSMSTRLRDPEKDYRMLGAEGNDRPRGIFSDGETMWVVDQTDNKFYAYHAHGKFASRNANQDFETLQSAGNRNPRGIWSDDKTLWVANPTNPRANKAKIFAYDLATQKRHEDKDFNTLIDAGNVHPTGLWSDKTTTMWIADYDDGKLYAYKLADKSRDPAKDFDLATANTRPIGIWSDGTTMWVADKDDDKIYAYEMANKSRHPSKDINVNTVIGKNLTPHGLWSDKTTMWVADNLGGANSQIYAFTLPSTGQSAARDAAKDFKTLGAAGNHHPRGLWSDGATMWVTEWKENRDSSA